MKLINTFSLAAIAATGVIAAPQIQETDFMVSEDPISNMPTFDDKEIAQAMKKIDNNAQAVADLKNGRLRKPLKEKIEQLAMEKMMEAGIPENFGMMLEEKQASMEKMMGMVKEMWMTHEMMKKDDNDMMSKRNVVVQGNMIVNNGEEINMVNHHDDNDDYDKHDDKPKKMRDNEMFDEAVEKFAKRAYMGYSGYQDCVHTVKYMAIEQLMSSEQMNDFMESMMPKVETVRATREADEAYYEKDDYKKEDYKKEAYMEQEDFPMSEMDIREYLMFDMNQDLKSFYMKNGEWLMEQMENMSPEEMTQMNEYLAMLGNMIPADKMEAHKILMPYIDHLTYQFCVVKPQFEMFADKYMPDGYDPKAEMEAHMEEMMEMEPSV